MKITEKIFNIETGEETFVEREETDDEKNQRLAYEQQIKEEAAIAEERALARQALLDKLGITAEEARLLLG
jgi:hypothetical protein